MYRGCVCSPGIFMEPKGEINMGKWNLINAFLYGLTGVIWIIGDRMIVGAVWLIGSMIWLIRFWCEKHKKN